MTETKKYYLGKKCPEEAFDNWYEVNHLHPDTPLKSKARWLLKNSVWSIPLSAVAGTFIAVPIWQLTEGNPWYAVGMWGAIGTPVAILAILYLVSSLKHWAFDVYNPDEKLKES